MTLYFWTSTLHSFHKILIPSKASGCRYEGITGRDMHCTQTWNKSWKMSF